MNGGGYLPSRGTAKKIATTFTDTEVNHCFSICHTSWKNRAKNFICENYPTSDRFLEFRALLDARRSIYLYNYHRPIISARVKSTIELCGTY